MMFADIVTFDTGDKLNTPGGTLLLDNERSWRATATYRCRTLRYRGPERVLEDNGVTITTDEYVALLPEAFLGFANGYEMIESTVAQTAVNDLVKWGMTYKDAAKYGPVVNGQKQEGADFYDFLGAMIFLDGTLRYPEAQMLACLDCSGFIRMVYGRHGGQELGWVSDNKLPRRSRDMHACNLGREIAEKKDLRLGDLVFFHSKDDPNLVSHVGFYLGLDQDGHQRYFSSRKTKDGPTFSNIGGPSILDGEGLYAKTFVGGRRL